MLYGIPRERVFVLDEFQDGPRNKWDAEKVSQIIRRYVQQLDVDVVCFPLKQKKKKKS